MHCTSCGTLTKIGDKFCASCGGQLATESAPHVDQQQTSPAGMCTVIKTKLIQGHTTNIDRTINAWATKEGVVVKNVTLSPQGYMGVAGWVTATVVYEKQEFQKANSTPSSGSEAEGCYALIALLVAIIFFVSVIAYMFNS